MTRDRKKVQLWDAGELRTIGDAADWEEVAIVVDVYLDKGGYDPASPGPERQRGGAGPLRLHAHHRCLTPPDHPSTRAPVTLGPRLRASARGVCQQAGSDRDRTAGVERAAGRRGWLLGPSGQASE
jgi:hypothetical protein